MGFRLSRILFVMSAALFIAAHAWGTDSPSRGETPYYTNEDIQRYKNPSEGEPAFTGKDKNTGREERAGKTEDREKEYWCKKAAPYRKKIDSAAEEIRVKEKELSENSLSPKKKKGLGKKLESSRRKLRNAERDLGYLEEEAYRKGIPPGWLRCQFE